MIYKGYIGYYDYDNDLHMFTGSVINSRDVITFQGDTIETLQREFHFSVDDYINWCNEDGIKPSIII